MTMFPVTPALLVWRGLRLGPLRLTPYGLCAAAGLLLGVGLSRQTARRLDLDPDAVWDAGLVAVLSCFVASRLLLVFRNPLAFAHYPLLVLGLPSLTYGGMALAALMVLAYVRVKKLPWRPLLDAFAAPAAMLAACLELGHWMDGTEAGMPTALPWGVHDAAFGGGLRLHPVALYGAVGALVVAGILWQLSSRRHAAGRIAGTGFLVGGLLAFGLDTLTVPAPALGKIWLEPGEWVAVIAMLAGAALWALPQTMPGAVSRTDGADVAAAAVEWRAR